MASDRRDLGAHPGPGDRVGRWTLVRLLGAGGMATVFLAQDADQQPAAIKVLNPARVLPEEVKRFTREYQALSKLQHENIVRVYDAGVLRDHPWIAMEYVDGSDLADLITAWQNSPTPDRFARAEKILRGLCEALQLVHERGLIHRDLKPSNVLVTKDGRAKLTDFGVVKDHNSNSTQLTMAGRLVGTVAFMAPELIAGDTVDHRADLYALGAVLYMMLTFRRPIEASSVAGYLARHLTEVPKAPSEIDSAVPRRLETLCTGLLQKNPAHRYPTARAVLQALDRPAGRQIQPLQGREREAARWVERIAELKDGNSGVFLLHGPRGSGLTHMFRTFVEQAESHGVSAVGFASIRDVTGPESHEGLADGLEELETSRSPLVFAVDDLDELDFVALDGLLSRFRNHIEEGTGPCVLLATAVDLDGNLAGLDIEVGVQPEIITLGPVEPKAITAMLRDRGLQGAFSTQLGRRLHQEVYGLPGYAARQLDTLVEANWLGKGAEGILHAVRPAKDWKGVDLPVPPLLKADLEGRLKGLSPGALAVARVLALIDHPVGLSTVSRMVSDPDQHRAVEALIRAGIVARTGEEESESLHLSHPAAARVMRGALDGGEKRRLHGAIAQGLAGGRRRSGSIEVARHLMLAGQEVEAVQMYVRTARKSGADPQEILEAVQAAMVAWPRVEPQLASDEAVKLKRWLGLLRGEGLLAKQQWAEAIVPLEEAVKAAREMPEEGALARCLGALGRAKYRLGDFDAAGPLLEEALALTEPGAPERAAVIRAVADIAIRNGDLSRSETLWNEALDLAIAARSVDAEARARRGLAHVRGTLGNLQEAADLLDRVDEMLANQGDERVRAGVLAKQIELDLVAGRFGSALRRAESLLRWTRDKELSERIPDALSLQADAFYVVGLDNDAAECNRQAGQFAKAIPDRCVMARLRIARVWCCLGRPQDALAIIPAPEEFAASRIDDPPGAYACIRARAEATTDPRRARDLVSWAFRREDPLYVVATAGICIDAARALTASGHHELARTAAKKGLKVLQGPARDGLRLELLLALNAPQPDERVLQTAGQVAQRILAQLPATVAESFRHRPEVAAALAAVTGS